MERSKVLRPTYKWADFDNHVHIRILVNNLNAKQIKLTADPSGSVNFHALKKNQEEYDMTWKMYNKIRPQHIFTKVYSTSVVLTIPKILKEKWPCLQKRNIKKPTNERVDWDRVCFEEEDNDSDSDRDSDDGSVHYTQQKVSEMTVEERLEQKRRVDFLRKHKIISPEMSADLNSGLPPSRGGDGQNFDYYSPEDKEINFYAMLKYILPKWAMHTIDFTGSLISTMKKFIGVFDVLMFFFMVVYILLCPYTKVEESFNMQAMHDMLYHGSDLAKYDHFEFPGVVPRTFIGALVVSIFSYPFVFVMKLFLGLAASKFYALILTRITLGTFLIISLSRFFFEIQSIFGQTTRKYCQLLLISQFHILFYASRPLPNVFALIIVLWAFKHWLREDYYITTVLFIFAATVFRCEIAMLGAPIILEALWKKRVSFWSLFFVGIITLMSSIVLTVLIDSFFWDRWIWPEGEVFYYNTVLNKSSNWGTSPWWWYFGVAFPKLSLFAVVFIPFGLYFHWETLGVYARPLFFFVCSYSLLPHKEVRFIFYVVPFLNLFVVEGLQMMFHTLDPVFFTTASFSSSKEKKKKSKKTRKKIGILMVKGIIYSIFFFNLVLTIAFVAKSASNYPGGVALNALHAYENENEIVNIKQKDFCHEYFVHIDNYAAISGVTRFGQVGTECDHSHGNNQKQISCWRYSKVEGIDPFSNEGAVLLRKSPFTHLITPAPYIQGFEIIHTVEVVVFKDIVRSFNTMKLPKEPLLYVMRRMNMQKFCMRTFEKENNL